MNQHAYGHTAFETPTSSASPRTCGTIETAMSTLHSLHTSDVELSGEAIAALCRKYGVTELAAFGSVLRDDFRPDSDVDFLATFRSNDVGPWMSKLQQLEEELARTLGRNVDVVTRNSVLQSQNYIRRRDILDSARVLYAE